VSNLSLMPVPAEQAGSTCANCGAALVSDQRYCLECGQPASPVRLAFLDVLQAEQSPVLAQGTVEMVPAEYRSAASQQGVSGWLRRNSGVLGLLGVLLLCLLVGLLIGHWVSQGSSTPSKQVVEVKGLSVAPAAATTTPTSTTATSTTSTTTSNSASKVKDEEAKEKAQEAKIEKAPLPAPVKASTKKLSTNPKKHEEEINSLGDQPIETG
jgi:cell division protein FtsN